MALLETTLAILSLVGTGVGAGVSYYGAQQQAKQQSAIAQYNYANQQKQAQIEYSLATQQANQNKKLAEYQQAVGLANAQQIRLTADGDRRANDEDIRRQRTEYLRMQASQRASIGKSGVQAAGSPLDVLAETAGRVELAIQDQHYKGELEQRSAYRQAAVTAAGAQIYGIDAAQEAYRGQIAGAAFGINRQNASIGRLSGLSQASGTRMAGYGSLLSGAAQFGSNYAGFKYNGAFSPSSNK